MATRRHLKSSETLSLSFFLETAGFLTSKENWNAMVQNEYN